MSETNTQTAQRPDQGDDAAAREQDIDYLEAEINIFKPATPFMRDHLKVVWATFLAWVLFIFGPVTATAIAPDLMTETIVLGFQLHFFLTAIGAPAGALLLSVVYARQRDALDDKFGIDHSADQSESESQAVAADGGDEQ
ncbi:DUF4212 domain-containing protein [Haloarchaeobius amylolyticus]|uniref:DUF4212 domain-containing protein n=1 Tax=Haloarchaeobius amylolyticus TaxID=1198296 RepID=UPI0022716F5F|nr:DUF4212 domain-containing protein [Haloarchaeobius amylolyticus]